MLEATRLSNAEIANFLCISAREFDLRRDDSGLSRGQWEKIGRLAAVTRQAEKALGDAESAQRWLTNGNSALQSRTPRALLDTASGAERVTALLLRIGEGRFA